MGKKAAREVVNGESELKRRRDKARGWKRGSCISSSTPTCFPSHSISRFSTLDQMPQLLLSTLLRRPCRTLSPPDSLVCISSGGICSEFCSLSSKSEGSLSVFSRSSRSSWYLALTILVDRSCVDVHLRNVGVVYSGAALSCGADNALLV